MLCISFCFSNLVAHIINYATKPDKPPNEDKSCIPISLLPIISTLFNKFLLKRLVIEKTHTKLQATKSLICSLTSFLYYNKLCTSTKAIAVGMHQLLQIMRCFIKTSYKIMRKLMLLQKKNFINAKCKISSSQVER